MATFSDSNHQAKIKIQATKNDNHGLWRDGKKCTYKHISILHQKNIQRQPHSIVTAPTGAAAYNVRGSIIHREFKINVRDIAGYNEMSDNTKKELMKKLLRTIALFFAERSMIGLMLLGQTETNIRETKNTKIIYSTSIILLGDPADRSHYLARSTRKFLNKG
jgi:hypothetical protein